MDTQQKRMLAVSAAAATLGLAAASLGIAAEYFTHKALVRSDGSSRSCEYRRTPALGFGVAAAVLSLAGVILVTAASRCFVGRRDDDVLAAGSDPHERGRCVGKVCAALAWLLAVAAAAMFLYGASWNAGRGRQGSFMAIYRLPGRFFYRCPELRKGFFVSASINAGLGITCAIAAYADLHRRKRNHQTVTLGGVAMGQPSYPPAPVAYPAQPPPCGAYGAKQPAGTV